MSKSYYPPNINLNQFSPMHFVHNPVKAGTSLIHYAEETKDNPGPTWGIPAMDRVVIPERPGEVVVIMGRPGDGKTSLMAYRARREALQIMADPAREGEIVVYVAWEGTVESLEPFWLADPEISKTDIAWGRADLDKLRHKVFTERTRMPIWMIGYSGEQRRTMGRDVRKVPQLTPEIVFEAIEGMQVTWPDQVRSIRLTLFDYIQRAPMAGSRDRFGMVGNNMVGVEDLAIRVGCPAITGAQASRDVDRPGRANSIANMDDAQDSSKIEQVPAKMFAAWRPWRTEVKKHPSSAIIKRADGVKVVQNAGFKLNGEEVELTETLLVLRMIKQRDDTSVHTWKMNFHPAYLSLMAF